MSTHEKRSEARAKGLRVAAKMAATFGVALTVLGLAEARAASATPASARAAIPTDDATRLPLEGLKVNAGGCGCAPCWGPPAPPARSGKRVRRAKRPSRTRGVR